MPLNLTFTTTRLLSAILSFIPVFPMVCSGHQQIEARASIRAALAHQVPADWDRYQLVDGEFSVQLPTVPAMSTYKLYPDPYAKSRLLHLIGAYSQGVGYAIYVFERKQSLEEFVHSFGHTSAADFKRQLDIAGVRGSEYAFQNDTRKGRTDYFITDRRIYIFEAQGSLLGNPDIGIPRFFDSIKFDQPLAGRVIVDGLGEPAPAEINAATTDAQVFRFKETAPKAVVVTKPEPVYTEAARGNQITGTVVLRCVFSSSGAVNDVRVLKALPYGLTEKAIAAARQIKFIPAVKDGHFVSMYMQLEYNFNLY